MYKIKNSKETSVEINYGTLVDKYLIDIDIMASKVSKQVKALIDTGANCSCISRDLVKALNMVPMDIVTISTPSSITQVNVYVINIRINDVTIEDVRVCDSNIGSQGLDLLLGTDIIGMGDLMVSNYNNMTIMSLRLPTKADLRF